MQTLVQQDAHPIYTASEHSIEDAIRSLRAGDEMLVTTLARLASNRGELRRAVETIHSKKAYVIEASTGRSTANAADAAEMVLDAIDELTTDARALTRKQAREFGRRGGRSNAKRYVREMGKDEAQAIWANPQLRDLSNEQIIERMPGWTIRAAYRHLKPRGLAKGRPRVSKQT